MKPVIVETSAANEAALQKATDEAAAKAKESGSWSDLATVLDTAGQAVGLAIGVGEAVVGGVRAVGKGIEAVCSIIPD